MATSLAGDFTEVTEYDALDRPVRSQQPYSSADPVYKTPANVFYTYDKVGRLTAMSNPTDAATKWWTQYTHFDNGLVKSSTDPFGIRTDYGYNRVGQQTARTLTSAAGTAKREMTWDYDLDGSLKSRSDAAAPAGVSEVLSDNSDQRETTPVGTWPTASTGTGFWGYNYQTHAKGTGTNTFTWDLVVPTTGTYEVKVRYPDGHAGAASNAQFTIGHAAGSTVKTVDQRTGGGTWVSLGSYTFAEGVGKSVKLTDAADGVVLADAVMLVRNDTTAERARRDLTYGDDLNGNLKTVDNTKAGASDYGISYAELNRPAQVTETTGSNTATTGYTYDAVGRPDTVTIDQVAPLKDQFYDYSWDVRGLLSSVVTGASASDPARKTTSYSYENRGLRASQTKGNRNKVVFTWFDNGSMASSREFKPDGKSLVTEHLLSYDADGNRVRDAARVLNSDTKALDSSTAVYTYEPRGRVTSVDRSGAGATDESYAYSASSNITSQTIDATTTNFVYERDRLQKSSVVNGPSSFHNHDPFGRLDTITSAGAVVGRYVYDGFDRIVEQRTGTGTGTKTTRSTFDAWDRVATKTDDKGKTTAMSYLGLSSQLLAELDTGTGKQKTAYTFDAQGQRLTQTTDKADGTSEDAWYGYAPRGDVENLTTATGEAKSTYGYTAYGKDRAGAMTGVDKPGVNPEPYNLYRFNAKRWDAASGDYDMGFRTYNPGLNRFTSRDMYSGALADLSLGTDPWNTNRYTYGGGNPVTRVEFDGHCNMAEEGGGCARSDDSTGYQTPASTIDAARRPADPTVRDQFGRHQVVAPDSATYKRAYAATTKKLVGTEGGQGPELAVACSELNKVVAGGGTRISCGLAHTVFANEFGAEMCSQPGMLCDASSNGWQALAMAGVGIGMGKDGSGGKTAAAGGRALFDVAARRVKLRKGTKEAILDAQRAPDGKLYDPNTGMEIADGKGHFGHRPGFEWWRTQQRAREEGWTRQQLIDYENDPTHYWYENPTSNLSHRYEMPR